jgi:hypothetical protein
MSSNLDKLKELTSKLEEKLSQKQPTENIPQTAIDTQNKAIFDYTQTREDNIKKVKELYLKLGIHEKSPDFDNIFSYKAMNLSGIGLKEEDFAQIREGKYIQVIAITYEPDKNGKKKAKNVSLGYFGKAQNVKEELRKDIIEFVLRWRYEKAFQNLEHYKELIAKVAEL